MLMMVSMVACMPTYLPPLLQDDWGWGIVVSVLRKPPPGAVPTPPPAAAGSGAAGGDSNTPGAAAAAAHQSSALGAADAAAGTDAASFYIVDTLLPVQPGSIKDGQVRPAPLGLPSWHAASTAAAETGSPRAGAADDGAAAAAAEGSAAVQQRKQQGKKAKQDKQQQQQPDMVVLPVSLKLVTNMSLLRMALPEDLRPPEARQALLCALQVYTAAGTGGYTALHYCCVCVFLGGGEGWVVWGEGESP